MLTCGGLRPNVDARVVPAQQVLYEGGLPCAVLPQQEHAGLGLKVRLRQQRAKEVAELVGLLQWADLQGKQSGSGGVGSGLYKWHAGGALPCLQLVAAPTSSDTGNRRDAQRPQQHMSAPFWLYDVQLWTQGSIGSKQTRWAVA